MQAADRQDLADRREASGGFGRHTPTQAFFLARLQDFIVRRQQSPEGEGKEWQSRLLDKALYSTYCDCLDLGLGDEAREQLRRHRQAQRS